MNTSLFLTTLILSVILISVTNAQGTYQGSIDFGAVVKGPLVTKNFANIALPALPIYIQAVQVVLLNKTSNQPFDHNDILVSSIDFLISGKKIISFTTSNILTPIQFPAPNVIVVDSAITINAAMITTNVESQDLVIEYFIKYTTDSSNIVKLTRTATSVLANFSSFDVPVGTGGYSVSNSLVWQQNSEATGFMASVSPGIISLSFSQGSTEICTSTPTYTTVGNVKYLQSMSLCEGTYQLVKGTSYTTTAIYDNSIARKGVFGNFGLYIGFPRATTTSSSSSGPSSSSTHSTSGPAASTTHSSTSGPSSSGPSSSGPSSSGPHSSSGPSSSGPSSSGPSSSGPSSSTTQSGTSGSFTTSEATGQTSGASNPTGDSTGSNPAGSTGYTVSSGSSGMWTPTRKIEIY